MFKVKENKKITILERLITSDNKSYYIADNGKIYNNSQLIKLIRQGRVTNVIIAKRLGKQYLRGLGSRIPQRKINRHKEKTCLSEDIISREIVPENKEARTQVATKLNDKEINLERDIYKKLLEWKETGTDKVLYLKGARQVGKTYILNQFARKQFKLENILYINLDYSTGQRFIKCYEYIKKRLTDTKNTRPTIGYGSSTEFWRKVFKLYNPNFKDSEETIIIIDEIQKHIGIYNSIREFHRSLKARVVVTGSYVGATKHNQVYSVATGDTVELHLGTLSYVEFLKAMGVYTEYEKIKTLEKTELTIQQEDIYNQVRKLYQIYCQIGGYPSVVLEYIRTKDIARCRKIVEDLYTKYVRESLTYFEDKLTEVNFQNILVNTLTDIINGTGSLSENKDRKIYEFDTSTLNSRTNKKGKITCTGWLNACGILGECIVTPTVRQSGASSVKYYFTDMGILSYILELVHIQVSTIKGILAENFVYLYLKANERETINYFDKSANREVDFILYPVAIEVKFSDGDTKSAKYLLEKGEIKHLLKLKDGFGTTVGSKTTAPIYAIDKAIAKIDKYIEEEREEISKIWD